MKTETVRTMKSTTISYEIEPVAMQRIECALEMIDRVSQSGNRAVVHELTVAARSELQRGITICIE
jgi:hypothetical protein